MSGKTHSKIIAVVGTGPAGLMCADVASAQGFQVHVFEKRSGPGWKLLVAGASGLNISNTVPIDEFLKNFRGPKERFKDLFQHFPREKWLEFLSTLGIPTFTGTSGRDFVEGLKAAPLLKAWTQRLQQQGVSFHYGREIHGFEAHADDVKLQFKSGEDFSAQAVCFALGGGSWEESAQSKPSWVKMFEKVHVSFVPFEAANAGFEINWPQNFLQEAQGLPIKNIVLKTALGEKAGEMIVTSYGLEGTPVYHIGKSGPVEIDLKPDLSEAELLKRLSGIKENFSPLRRAKRTLNLCPASLALLFHMTPKEVQENLSAFVHFLKHFPLVFGEKRGLQEAISSSGGISWESVEKGYSLRGLPHVFVAGEMLDWDAPTGGYLIHACVAMGFLAAKNLCHKQTFQRKMGVE